jgi:hypothetical protein
MGEHDQDRGDVAEPARPPLTAARARGITAGLREAMDDVRRSVAVLAARVRDAHAARVWVPLRHSSRSRTAPRSSASPSCGAAQGPAACRRAPIRSGHGEPDRPPAP